MFKHQPGHISIMNTEHEIKLTAILDLHVPLTLSVTSMRSDRLIVRSLSMNSLSRLTERTRHAHNNGRSNLKTLLNQQI